MTGLGQDARQALRTVFVQRKIAIPVVLSLALGIGVNSAIFSVIDGLLLRPLPYRDAGRLVVLSQVLSGDPETYGASYQDFMAWREQSRGLEAIEAMQSTFHNLTGLRQPERIACGLVSPGLFDLLGARPTRGRGFRREEGVAGGPPAAVLSYGFWQRRLGGSAGVLGQALTLDGRSYSIVGIMSPRFSFVQEVDLWLPMVLDAANPPYSPQTRYLFVTGRLKAGAAVEQVVTEMSAIGARMARQIPEDTGWRVEITPLRDNLIGDLRPALLVLLAAVGFVLLIACSNVTNLLLVRTSGRRGELAIRCSLGANRWRIARQVTTESVLLSIIGGLLGVALAGGIVWVLPWISPAQVLLLRDVTIDAWVLAFTLAVALATGLVPGLVVARRSLVELSEDMRSAGRRSTEGRHGRRLQHGLVIAEVALSLVLVVGAGLLLKSFHRLSDESPGFDSRNVLIAQVSLPDLKYGTPDRMRAFWRELLPRVQSLPGVVAAGTTHALPVTDSTLTTPFEVEGRVPSAASESLSANFRKVSPGFFAALRLPLAAGRTFNDLDNEHAPAVAVVSREMAQRYWRGADPIGKRMRRIKRPWLTIVGVVGDVQDGLPGSKFGNTFYVPYAQDPKSGLATVYLLARTSMPPFELARGVREAVLAVDHDQPVDSMITMDEWLRIPAKATTHSDGRRPPVGARR